MSTTNPEVNRIATLHGVARLAGVSHTTASNVLNRPRFADCVAAETAARVRDAAKKLGYRPHPGARALVSGRTNTVVLLTRTTLESAPVHDLLWAIQGYLSDQDYRLDIALMHRVKNEDAVYDSLVPGCCDAVIDMGVSAQGQKRLEETRRTGIPVLSLGGNENNDDDSVGIRLLDVYRASVDHLQSLGHRRWARTQALFTHSRPEEEDAFRAAIIQAGLPLPSAIVKVRPEDDTATVVWPSLRNLPKRPTALIVQSDHFAAQLMKCIHADGFRIPEDMAILATADSMWSCLTNPPVTTVSLPAKEYGKAVVETLMFRIKNPSAPPCHLYLKPTLVVRESTAGACAGSFH